MDSAECRTEYDTLRYFVLGVILGVILGVVLGVVLRGTPGSAAPPRREHFVECLDRTV